FIGMTALGVALYFLPWSKTTATFYALCFYLGFSTGYWAVFVTIASEQFGTNLRATAATTVPNFVRGAVVPLTAAFQVAKPAVGVVPAALFIGLSTLLVVALSLAALSETFGRDLDFFEA